MQNEIDLSESEDSLKFRACIPVILGFYVSESVLAGAGHSHAPTPSPVMMSTKMKKSDGHDHDHEEESKFSLGLDLAMTKGWKEAPKSEVGSGAHSHTEGNLDDTELSAYGAYQFTDELGVNATASYMATAGTQDPAIGPFYNIQLGPIFWMTSASIAAPASKSSREQGRVATANATAMGLWNYRRFATTFGFAYSYALYQNSKETAAQASHHGVASGRGINPNALPPTLPSVGHDDHSPQKQRGGVLFRSDYTVNKSVKAGLGYNLSRNDYYENPTSYEAEATIGRVSYTQSEYELSFSVGLKEEATTIKTPSQGFSRLGITLSM